jgi:hypothetical protein
MIRSHTRKKKVYTGGSEEALTSGWKLTAQRESVFTGGNGGNGGKKEECIARKNISFWHENGGESREFKNMCLTEGDKDDGYRREGVLR